MFASTGWLLIESSGAAPRVQHPVDVQQQLSIVRVNEFEHGRRSMSAVVRDDITEELHIFCKVTVTIMAMMALIILMIVQYQ